MKLIILEPRQKSDNLSTSHLFYKAPASDGDSDPLRLVRKVLKKDWESWESLLFCVLYGNGELVHSTEMMMSGTAATTWRFGFAQRLDSSPKPEFSVVFTGTGRGDHHG